MKTVIILLTLFSHTLFATEVKLEEIQVTHVRGNKDDRSYMETNESVSVLDEKNLNRGDIANSVQMLNGFANVQTNNDKNGETFSIRGISDMGVTGFQKDNLATILVDDVFQTPLSLRAGSFENWDLETIEIRRGAQSTDQGVNSLAGNILLYHKAPSFTNEGAGKLGLGTYGRKEGGFVLNRAVNDKLAIRSSYNKEDRDGYIQNKATGNEKWNESKKDHYVADFIYKIGDKDDLRFNVKLLRMHRGGNYVQNFPNYEVSEDQDTKEYVSNQQLAITYNKHLTDQWQNKLILAGTQARTSEKSDEDGTAENKAGTEFGTEKDKFLSLENQLKFKSVNFKNVLGLHLHHYYLNSKFSMNMMFTSSQIYPVSQENTKYRDTYALFDTAVWNLDSHHAIQLGGRVEVVENKYGNDIQIPSASPYGTLAGDFEDRASNTQLLPKIGYTYKNGLYSLGATYTEGYRTGGVSVNRWRATTSTYDPETTKNFELSYKFQGTRLTFAANAFYTNWLDQQVEVANLNSFDTQVQNASTSELYGSELESTYQFDNSDRIRLNLGYVRTQFLSFNNSGESFSGNQFPNSAPVTAQLSYWKPLTDRWLLILVSRYVSESWTDVNNTRWSPEQFYTDVNTQYHADDYMVEIYLRNLLDQRYRVLNGAPRTLSTPYQSSYHRVSSPREIGARLNYYF